MDKNMNCTWCYNKTDKKCDFPSECKDYSHYACKDMVTPLIEEAEKRHREKGGLVVCDHAEEKCKDNIMCGDSTRLPHVFSEVDDYLSWECNGRKCKRIAFRGEPTKEDEVQEYVVVKDINIKSLTLVDNEKIDDALKIIRCFCDFKHDQKVKEGYKINKNDTPYHFLIKHIEELESLDFIEKVVHDPVVNDGDCFTDKEGSFYIVKNPDANVWDLVNLTGNNNYNLHSIANPRLSNIVGKDDLKYFKPVKIKITEVEEG